MQVGMRDMGWRLYRVFHVCLPEAEQRVPVRRSSRSGPDRYLFGGSRRFVPFLGPKFCFLLELYFVLILL